MYQGFIRAAKYAPVFINWNMEEGLGLESVFWRGGDDCQVMIMIALCKMIQKLSQKCLFHLMLWLISSAESFIAENFIVLFWRQGADYNIV